MNNRRRVYRTRRIPALILAVVMMITVLPVSAFAAPADDSNAIVLTDSDAVSDEGSAISLTDSDAVSDDSERISSEADDGSDGGSKPRADSEPLADEVSAPVYQIITEGLETEAAYTGNPVFDLSRVRISKTQDGMAEEVNAPITCVWKVKGADGSYTPLEAGTEPVQAGSYRAELSFAKEEGVHNGAEAVIDFMITKAAVEIQLQSVTIEPGTDCKDVRAVEPAVERIVTVPATVDGLGAEDIVLAVTGVRKAFGTGAVNDGEKLMKNEDYVLDIRVAFREDVSEERTALYANYKLPEALTADVVMGDLIRTRVNITVPDKWPEGVVHLKQYDGRPAEAPVSGQDYTCEVQYLGKSGYVRLDNARVDGSWEAYSEDCLDQNGNVAAPTDAGEYFYRLTYQGEAGEYAASYADIPVVIDPAAVTVEITNAEIENKRTLKVTAGTAMREVLSKVTYRAYSMDQEGRRIDIDVSKKHIWGTGYNDSNAAQIYEPLFVLQVKEKDSDAWNEVEEAEYRLESGSSYRVIYNGRKALYNADGTYGHRTGINSGLDESREEINGMDPNYLTDETPTADEKALVVEVLEGTKAELDISKLLQDGKAGLTPETAPGCEYDGQYIYSDRSAYKNPVVLKAGNRTLPAVGEEFTYTWYKSAAQDLLEKQIWDKNREQGFTEEPDFEDDSNWHLYGLLCPKDAGIYKLVISYEDQTDDGTFYYVEEPAVAYYVVSKRQIKVLPKGSYDTFSGRTIAGFFRDNEVTYDISGLLQGWSGDVSWQVNEKLSTDSQDQIENVYDWDDESVIFRPEEEASYALQAGTVIITNGDRDDSDNYTCYASEIAYDQVDGKQKAYRLERSLNETAVIQVKTTGSAKLTVVATDASKVLTKVYDGTGFTKSEMDALVRVTGENGQVIPAGDLRLRYRCERTTDGVAGDSEECSDAGEYAVYADFEGDESYAPLESIVQIGTAKITRRPVTVSVSLPASYEAGVRAEEIIDDARGSITVAGYVEQEEELFQEWYDADSGRYVLDAWREGPAFLVYEKGSSIPLGKSEILHRNKDFEVRYDPADSHLSDSCQIWDEKIGGWKEIAVANNYEVTTAATEVLAGFRAATGSSGVESVGITSVSGSGVPKVAIASPETVSDEEGNITQTVRILEGISYSSCLLAGEKLTGNLVAFRITAPGEFDGRIPDTAMYENEVERNGGCIVDSNQEQGYFTVLFDAQDGSTTFRVRWEDGYFETFVLAFDEAQLLGNLEDAVAPGSLAFNAPLKKMAAGSSQQLDVKITKAQMGDVISLGYESSDDQILCVNENGVLTALKRGKATVTVYARHMDKDGEMVPIMDASGKKYAKSAKAVISVTALTAPKSVKVSAHGTYADLIYSTPADGYRREIYVVDNQVNPGLKKAADIEKKIKAMTNNRWQGTFAIAPLYLDGADEILNQDRSQYTARLEGLKTTGQYTVYVRNVCAARTLEDGCAIEQETVNDSAAGRAVSFKTRKAENLALHLQITDLSNNSGSVEGITDLGQRKGSGGNDLDGHRYRIELSQLAKGSVDCLTFGEYALSAKDPAAEAGDRMMRPLPLSDKRYYSDHDSSDKNYYEEPKLEYALNCWNQTTGRYEWLSKNEFASIDKKGRIKLTGVTGESSGFTVRVRDTVTGHYTYAELYVVADVDSVAAKKKSVNLSVGQEIDLNDPALYTYKAGKRKLTGYRWPDMTCELVENAIGEQHQEKYFELDESGILRAIEAGGKLELTLTDKTVEKNTGSKNAATVKMTLKSTALTPVKKLKAYDVIHDRFGLTFMHAGGADAFRIEITDEGGRKIYDKRHEIYDESIHGKNTDYKVFAVYDDKNERVKDTYRVRAEDIRDYVKLARESRHTVRITALYGAVSSKAAAVKVKTTKIPVQDWYLDSKTTVGGMEILVSEGGRRLRYGQGRLNIVSGNSYTLTAVIENERGRVGDTLTWSVSDGKTASVKAAAGSYCITMRGLKPGQTTLEVKSKILGKKVIARYEINVVAVGDAYKQPEKRYYGENEPEEWEDAGAGNGSDSMPEYLPLSAGDLRKVTAGEIRSGQADGLFSFTAPENGRYRFTALGYQNDYATVSLYRKNSKNAGWGYPDRSGTIDLGWMEAGETVYLKSAYTSNYSYYTANNVYYVEVEFTQRMKPLNADGTTTVTGEGSYSCFKFTAQEDACYQFSAVSEQGQNAVLYLYTKEQSAADDNTGDCVDYGDAVEYFVPKGDSVWLGAFLDNGQEYTFRVRKVSIDMTPGIPVSVTVKARETKYVTFHVPQDGYYRIACTTEPADAGMLFALRVNGSYDGAGTLRASSFEKKKALDQGDSVCLEITSNDDREVTFTVTIEDITPVELPEQKPGETTYISADSDTLYQYTAPEAGAYQFKMMILDTGREDADSVEFRIWDSISDVESGTPLAVSRISISLSGASPDGGGTVTSFCYVGMTLRAGQTVYIQGVNRLGRELEVAIDAEKKSFPELTAGGEANVIEIREAYAPYWQMFTAPETGIYSFESDSVSAGIRFRLYEDGVYKTTEREGELVDTVDGRLNKQLQLQEGQTVVWMVSLEDEPYTLGDVSMRVVLTEILYTI